MIRSVAAAGSDVGRRRSQNEDNYVIDSDLGLYAVSDGMGGHAAGEVASAKAVEVVLRVIAEHRNIVEGVTAGQRQLSDLTWLAEKAAQEACAEVYELATSEEGQAGMGCTLTLLLHAGKRAAMAHVGDSRLYLVRGDDVSQLSSDHTLIAELLAAGAIEPGDNPIGLSPHVLSRAIGTQPVVKVDTMLLEVLPGDAFLLCSDGYSNYLDDPDQLIDAYREPDLDKLAACLVDEANAAGGSDNITVVVVATEADEEDEPHAARVASLHDNYDALSSVFLFEELELGQLTQVLNACEVDRHAPGEELLEQGQQCGALLVVVDGNVALIRDGDTVGKLSAGDHVGATTLLAPRAARATVRALGPSRVLRLERKKLRSLVREVPWLGMQLLDTLARRLSSDLDRSFMQREGSGHAVPDRERF